jgi:ribosome recycling factor
LGRKDVLQSAVEQGEKDKDLTEDDRDSLKEEIQKLTNNYEEKVNEAAKTRESEVMEDA